MSKTLRWKKTVLSDTDVEFEYHDPKSLIDMVIYFREMEGGQTHVHGISSFDGEYATEKSVTLKSPLKIAILSFYDIYQQLVYETKKRFDTGSQNFNKLITPVA